jgi:peptidoglycan/xylan/chitin deacetylase (PgdA/CDA1 family)
VSQARGRPGHARRRTGGAAAAARLLALLAAAALAVMAAVPGSAPARAQAVSPDRSPRAARAPAARAVAAPGGARAATAGQTVVSFTFDDGDADQATAARILHRYHMAGTFYIITGAVGTPGYLTMAQLHWLATQGDEIGAHTVSHLELTGITPAEARRQACMSRAILTGWGFRVTSFAYPGGAADRRAEAIAAGCGFDSARLTTGLRNGGCPGCRITESIPPATPMGIRTPGELDGSWTLRDLEDLVTRAERAGGGWLPLIFHHICTARQCGPLSARASMLNAFAHWLAGRSRGGTVVRTVSQVTGGPDRAVQRTRPAAPHGIVNGSLESAGPSGAVNPQIEAARGGPVLPRCWMIGGYGQNTASWQRTAGARSGRWAERLTVTGYHSGDAKLLQQFDLGQCSLPVTPGRAYTLGSWYRSSAAIQYSVYYRTASGRWAYWTSGPYFPASSGWAQATWVTPPVPAGASGLSFGLALFHRGWLITDSYSFGPVPANVARRVADAVVLAGLAAAAALAAARAIRRRRRAVKLARPDGKRAASSSRP